MKDSVTDSTDPRICTILPLAGFGDSCVASMVEAGPSSSSSGLTVGQPGGIGKGLDSGTTTVPMSMSCESPQCEPMKTLESLRWVIVVGGLV